MVVASSMSFKKTRLLLTRLFLVFRFLTGSLRVDGVLTENLKDVWENACDNSDHTGLTFSTLERQLTKRVSSNSLFVLLEYV